ncbi:MAG: ADP-glyceromanno-heptose 6-epimerase [Omnitrophica WOR_2 bacterium RIFCSPLOWO2_12_FULL_51_24]|nr:MAG: ADP-glyceromanno-heptose 6-epimerase [Omnitrophica WOR_2 bacterium RIFCSPHIGHO2_01_FULL_49_10]OGX33110.1 MAG: ADP-glyceromanno-heptose 6-epimerase [Omnitrophica WOR_2 bacterium RIFCSPLOWO2_02_FULL_50_19]OGX43528.1 MAG: ADP-glyceromanno-heptose 6-epimerase [Omnitrophica WOR_2 bacterium RIFCSPLOWO2_12_FULL_51_24]
MKFLVTGAAGLIGSNLALELQKHGKVIALDDLSAGKRQNLARFRGDFMRADIRTANYPKFLKECDAIFHEAAITDTTVTDKHLMFSVNVDAFKRLLIYAKSIGCRKIVYASSAATYGKGKVPMKETDRPAPANIYGESKVRMEQAAKAFVKENPGFSVIGLRYFNVYGPGETHKKKAASMIYQLYLQMAAGKHPRIFKWGEQYRDFIYVKDVVGANLKTLKYKNSGIFNVGTGVPGTFNRVIEVLNKAMRKDLRPEYFDNPYGFYQERTQADMSSSRAELKFVPQYNVEKGIRDYVSILNPKICIRKSRK